MIAQVGIALLGVTAIWLSQSQRHSHRKYACLFGLASQPFWFWSAVEAGQWGVFVLCCFYTLAWAQGVKNNWFDTIKTLRWEFAFARQMMRRTNLTFSDAWACAESWVDSYGTDDFTGEEAADEELSCWKD